MQPTTTQKDNGFVERRQYEQDANRGVERRQFQDGNRSKNPDVAELANAVDQYKLRHRRRFITFDELLEVVKSLGYSR